MEANFISEISSTIEIIPHFITGMILFLLASSLLRWIISAIWGRLAGMVFGIAISAFALKSFLTEDSVILNLLLHLGELALRGV